MKKLALILALSALLPALALSAHAGQNKTAPPKSVNDSKSKPPICAWECVQWNDNGSCAREKYVCH